MGRSWVWGAGILVAAVAGGLLWQHRGGEAPEAQPPFAGVRGRMTGVVFSQTDPSSGGVLLVRAGRVVTRDDRVGVIFRSPAKQTVEVFDVTAELQEGDGWRLSGRCHGPRS